jgi:hypothetical protein
MQRIRTPPTRNAILIATLFSKPKKLKTNRTLFGSGCRDRDAKPWQQSPNPKFRLSGEVQDSKTDDDYALQIDSGLPML